MSKTHELVEILQQTRELIARSDNEFVWSRWEKATDALREFDAFIAQIESGDTSGLPLLKLLFAATGSIQEVSISTGWGEEFLAVSEKFDRIIERL